MPRMSGIRKCEWFYWVNHKLKLIYCFCSDCVYPLDSIQCQFVTDLLQSLAYSGVAIREFSGLVWKTKERSFSYFILCELAGDFSVKTKYLTEIQPFSKQPVCRVTWRSHFVREHPSKGNGSFLVKQYHKQQPYHRISVPKRFYFWMFCASPNDVQSPYAVKAFFLVKTCSANFGHHWLPSSGYSSTI